MGYCTGFGFPAETSPSPKTPLHKEPAKAWKDSSNAAVEAEAMALVEPKKHAPLEQDASVEAHLPTSPGSPNQIPHKNP